MQKGSTPSASGYASVALGQTVVARIDIGDWYTAGKNDAEGDYTPVTRHFYGKLYSMTTPSNPEEEGDGSWFLVRSNTRTLYQK